MKNPLDNNSIIININFTVIFYGDDIIMFNIL